MTLYRWQKTVQNTETGSIIVNPTITVRDASTNALSDIFDDAGVAKSNPFNGTADGFVSFRVHPGRYIIEGVKSGIEAENWIEDIGDTNQPFSTRAEAVTLITGPVGWVPENNRTYIIQGVEYIGSTGATGIPDLPGLIPLGPITPQHFGGVTGAAVSAAATYWAAVCSTPPGASNASTTAKKLHFPAGRYNVGGALITITTNGTGSVITGDGESSVLENISFTIADFHVNIGGFKLTGGSFASPGITVSPRGSSVRFGRVGHITVRDRLYGMSVGGDNAWIDVNNCFFERNADGVIIDTTSNISFDMCDFRLNTGYGFNAKNGGEIRATHCGFSSNGFEGLNIDVSGDGVTTENYFESCSFSNNCTSPGYRDSFSITGAASNGSGGTTLTIGPHNMTEGMQGVVIAGTTSYNAATQVFNVTNTTVDVAVPFVANETGTLTRPEWDVSVTGDPSNIGNMNDMFFTDCNLNFVKLKDCYNTTFIGCRNKEQLWLDGGCRRVTRIGMGRGRQVVSTKDVDISGQNYGFSEFIQTTPGTPSFTSGNDGMVMRAPDDSAPLLGNKPSAYHYVQATASDGVKIGGLAAATGSAIDGTGSLSSGAIVEHGSNVNGSFTRYADGTLVCFSGTVTIDVATAAGSGFRSAEYDWTLPYTMVNSTYFVAPANVANSSTHWVAARPLSTTQARATAYAFTSQTARGIKFMARGLWK